MREKRPFELLDALRKRALTWISGPAGSGKTMLAASWLDAKELPCIWYKLDEGDSDIEAFFYDMGLAAAKAAPRHRKPLPLLTSEYLLGVPVFTPSMPRPVATSPSRFAGSCPEMAKDLNLQLIEQTQ
jgi:hypothetical protein